MNNMRLWATRMRLGLFIIIAVTLSACYPVYESGKSDLPSNVEDCGKYINSPGPSSKPKSDTETYYTTCMYDLHQTKPVNDSELQQFIESELYLNFKDSTDVRRVADRVKSDGVITYKELNEIREAISLSSLKEKIQAL